MGLDMFVGKTKLPIEKDVDFDFAKDQRDEIEELFYWRKHPNLHGWMRDLYENKGGTDKEFNCSKLKLTKEDLDMLEAEIKAKTLPPTSGFFFGESFNNDEERNKDLKFVELAREAIDEGYNIFYDSSW